MDMLKTAPRRSTRLYRGYILLANAQRVDTRPVQARLDAFTDVQRRYIEAAIQVEEAQDLERAAQRRLHELDRLQRNALVVLSATLLVDGEPRRNPFSRYGDHTLSEIEELSVRHRVKAANDLVASLRRAVGVSRAALAAAAELEQCARNVANALAGWQLRQSYLMLMRRSRDSLGAQWDTAYSALLHLAKSIVEDRMLHATLFPRLKRSAKKTQAAEEQQSAAAPEPQNIAAIGETGSAPQAAAPKLDDIAAVAETVSTPPTAKPDNADAVVETARSPHAEAVRLLYDAAQPRAA